MNTVADLLKSKDGNVLTVSPGEAVSEGLKKMEEISAGTAVVVLEGDAIGIVSERDVIRKGVLGNMDLNTVKNGRHYEHRAYYDYT